MSRRCPARVARATSFIAVAAIGICGVSTVAAEVTLLGLDDDLRDNTLLMMRLDDEPCDAPKWRINSLFKESTRRIQRSLRAYGYYNASITPALSMGEQCWEARYDIELGPPVLLRSIDVRLDGERSTAPRLEKLITNQPFRRGERLQHDTYEQFKKKLLDTAISNGFFDARYAASRIDVYASQNAADISLVLIPGKRYQIAEVEFAQDTVTPELVRRLSNIEAGQDYSATAIGELYDNLLASGYFESINIETTPRGAPENDVLVRVALTPSKPTSIEAGVGFGTDTGLKLRAGYRNRRRNTKGHQFEANASWSQILSEVSAGYRIPLNNPRAEWLNFDAGYRDEDTDTSKSQTIKFGVKELKLRRHGWLETRFVDISFEDFEVAGQTGTSRLIAPGLSWSHVASNMPGRPTKGHRLNLRINGTHQALGSDTNFAQFDAYAKWLRQLWPGGRVLVRGEFGTTVKEDFSELPASVRYFVGGDNSVRGYDYKELGPRNTLGEVIGGSHKITGSIEIDQKFRENWGVAVFADSGNAFDGFDSINPKTSVGLGLRWYSFLGPIRVDLAVPLDDDADDSVRLHINLGPDL